MESDVDIPVPLDERVAEIWSFQEIITTPFWIVPEHELDHGHDTPPHLPKIKQAQRDIGLRDENEEQR